MSGIMVTVILIFDDDLFLKFCFIFKIQILSVLIKKLILNSQAFVAAHIAFRSS